jgi:hypothetical protein
MKRQFLKQGRSIWTTEENKYLVELVQGKRSSSWSEVAQYLTLKFNRKKTGKQCRERYRNYENPNIEKSDWKHNEKLLFIVMHQVFGNQWSNISKHLNSRSDVTIKNYFYYQIRKVTKCLKQMRISQSRLKRPEKFYIMFTILKRIQDEYLPKVKLIDTLPKYGLKERIILNLLKEKKITEQNLNLYIQFILTEFKRFHCFSTFPLEIQLPLTQFSFSDEKAAELVSKYASYNIPPLNQVIIIKITNKLSHINQITTELQEFNPRISNIFFNPTLYCPQMSFNNFNFFLNPQAPHLSYPMIINIESNFYLNSIILPWMNNQGVGREHKQQ